MTTKDEKTEPIDTTGMTFVEALDLRDQHHRHQLELQAERAKAEEKSEKLRLRTKRQETYQVAAISLAVVLVLIALIGAIYLGTTGGPDAGAIEQERERDCVSAGGGYVPKDLLEMSDHGICVFPGGSVEKSDIEQ